MSGPVSLHTRRSLLRSVPASFAFGAHVRAAESDMRLPREVWVASLSLEGLSARSPELMSKAVLARMEETLPYRPDIVCTPEAFAFARAGARGSIAEIAEKPVGTVCRPFAEFAKRNHCYVVCSTYTKDGGRYYNSAVLLDRAGEVVGEYRKIHPTVSELEHGITPGPLDPPVFRTDFGVVGFQICFDINWHEAWSKLRKAGAEIVFWPSAFGGGSALNMLAGLNKYHVVSSTHKGTTKLCDINGDEMASTGWQQPWLCAPVNLEKALIHSWPFCRHYKAIQAKYGRRVSIRIMHENEWTILESRSPEVKVADVLKEFAIPTYEEYMAASDASQRARRP